MNDITDQALDEDAREAGLERPPDRFNDRGFGQAFRGAGHSPPTGISNSYQPPPAAALFGQLLAFINGQLGAPQHATGKPGTTPTADQEALDEPLVGPSTFGAEKLGKLGALAGMLKGVKGATRDELAALEKAQALHAAGKPAEAWERYGWERGPAGDWFGHVEGPNPTIDRAGLGKYYELQKSYRDPGLFRAYPELAKLSVRPWHTVPDTVTGGLDMLKNHLLLNPRYLQAASDEDLRRTMGHELQHAIQRIENAPGGSNLWEHLPDTHEVQKSLLFGGMSDLADQLRAKEGLDLTEDMLNKLFMIHRGAAHPDPSTDAYLRQLLKRVQTIEPKFAHYFDRGSELFDKELAADKKYRQSAGEVQARVAGDRMSLLSESERRATPPIMLEDEPREDQWVRRTHDQIRELKQRQGTR